MDFKLNVATAVFIMAFCFSCHQDPENEQMKDHFNYIFLGHIYETESTFDRRLLNIDFDYFDQIWLGGDICSETTKEIETLDFLDYFFDLSSPNTHWALGNHDIRNGNVHWITEKTQRPTFYATSFNGITLAVLNTNFHHGGVYDTIQLNRQFDMIQSVCDTIQKSSHLIILSHAVMWKSIDGVEDVNEAANAEFDYVLVHIEPEKRFPDGIYPMLQQVAERGVKVINIAGDFGQKQTAFEAVTDDGIYFIGSGITSETEYNQQFPSQRKPDKILILEHNQKMKEILWDFVKI